MNNIRKDFPLLLHKRVHDMPVYYLDSASTSQKPQAVIDALVKTYTTFNANPGRAIYELAEEATRHYENARKKIAHFINAKVHEIVFVRGATEGINFIAQGWAVQHIKAGDEIVLSELEHHANLVPWQRVAKQTGALLKFIPITKDGNLCYDAIESIIHKKTKLVAITHRSNAIGTPIQLQPIMEAASRVQARVLVDASQSAPHEYIDVQKIGADFLVFSGHKALGPTASGVLYINTKIADQVEPLLLGGGSVLEVDWNYTKLRQPPEKFEAGTVALASVVGLAAAIDYLKEKVPFDALKQYEGDLCNRLITGLERYKKITILGPKKLLRAQGHMVTFVIDSIHPHDVAAYLDQHKGVAVRAGHFCAQPLMKKLGYPAAIRASFYCYSTTEDIDRLLEGIYELV